MREAETLIRSGVKEICLIAQDITYYGMDKWTDARPNRRSAVDSSRGESLASLLRALNAIEENSGSGCSTPTPPTGATN